MKTTIEVLQNYYLDYRNNFLTIGAFADYYCIPDAAATFLIEAGKSSHEFLVNLHKE